MTDPLVGTTVAHYEVLGKLDGGGMGVVYTARNVRLGQIVALKFLPPQWSHDESAKQRFLREAQAASATNHRNICTIHDIETASDGQLFIVMAYYQGETLKQKLEAGALPVEEAVEIAAQVAEGLAKAHSEGIFHRDIKPGNLMLVDGDVKILDFGLAKFANSLQLTIEGSTLGTVAYMSPEQTRGEEADARSDVWSLGVVLYEMLAGARPFKGAYPEAVSHAIRNDPAPPIRSNGAELPAELLKILERALQKDPAARYPNARELARELRQLQGRTIPLDLITAPIHAPALQLPPRRRWWRSRTAAAAAALVVVGGVAATVWLFTPVERVSVVVAPVVNQTGYAELDTYRPALTAELINELADSSALRVLPYDRELEILARFRAAGQDISSREALQALAAQSGAQVVVAPALTYENGGWHARIEFRDASTATNIVVANTTPVVSSLIKESVYGLMPAAAALVDGHFLATGPRRANLAYKLRRISGLASPAPSRRFGTLDAAAAFEGALDAYGQMEYASALAAFTEASRQDPRNPMLLAWRALLARVSRRDDIAAESADRATRLLTDQTSAADRMYIQAVAADARRDAATAETLYRARVDRHPDDTAAIMQLAAFQDRENHNSDAVGSYLAAVTGDGHLARPNVELCRMYNRLNEIPKAKEYAEKALAAYRALGARNGEGQALFCLADALKVGSDTDREQARRYAESATEIFQALDAPYNLARAYNYQALIAGMQNRRADSARLGETALAIAKESGNLVLQPLLLMNLGVTYEALGDRPRAADYYLQSSKLYEALGDQARAAENQSNRGALLIQFSATPEEGLRNVQNALAVSRTLGNKTFEVFCLNMIASHYLNVGRHADAERTFNQALAVARERELKDAIFGTSAIQIKHASAKILIGDYTGARELLSNVLRTAGTANDDLEAVILMAQVDAHVGDFDAARAGVRRAAPRLESGERALTPLLHLVAGEGEYEAGRYQDARKWFTQAADLWNDDLPDVASVKARAYLGLLDALDGRLQGRRALETSLAHAHKVGRLPLEAFCRVLLARIDVTERKFDDALRMLQPIPPDDAERTIGAELRAQVHYWQMQALTGRGDNAKAQVEVQAARRAIETLRSSLSTSYRTTFTNRPDIRRIVG